MKLIWLFQSLCVAAGLVSFFSFWEYVYQRSVQKRTGKTTKKALLVSFATYVISYLVWMVIE